MSCKREEGGGVRKGEERGEGEGDGKGDGNELG